MHVMPEGIDYGVIDDTSARGHGSFSRSTRVLWLLSSILKFNRRFVDGGGMSGQAMYDVIANNMVQIVDNIVMVVIRVTRRPCSLAGQQAAAKLARLTYSYQTASPRPSF